MKNNTYISPIGFVLLLILFFSACQENETTRALTKEDLPQITQDFILKYFPGKEYCEIQKLDTPDFESRYYTVFLDEKKIETRFDQSGHWIYVENNDGLPFSLFELIPGKIKTYLDKTYPDFVLTEIENKQYIYEVDLNKIRSLAFDREGEYLGIDMDDYNNTIPPKGAELIKEYFGDISMIVVKEQDDVYSKESYMVYLWNKYKMKFASTGRWMLIDAGTESLSDSFMKLLPTEMLDAFNKANLASNKIVAIGSPDEKYYQIIYLDATNQKKIFEYKMKDYVPLATMTESLHYIQEFIEEFFPTETIETPSSHIYHDPMYFDVTLSNNIYLYFCQRRCLHEVDTRKLMPIVEKIVNMFSPKIAEYIALKYPGIDATRIKRVDTGFEVTLFNDKKLQFDLQGTFVKEL